MEQGYSNRVPPHQIDAEKSVLGCMLGSSRAVMLAQESLTKDDFYDPAHQEIFDAMMHLTSTSQPVDLVTLQNELTRRGKLEGVGGLDYLLYYYMWNYDAVQTVFVRWHLPVIFLTAGAVLPLYPVFKLIKRRLLPPSGNANEA